MMPEKISDTDISFVNDACRALYHGFQKQIAAVGKQAKYLDAEFRDYVANESQFFSAMNAIVPEDIDYFKSAGMENDIYGMIKLQRIYVTSVGRVTAKIERKISDIDADSIDTPDELNKLMSHVCLHNDSSSEGYRFLEQMNQIWHGFNGLHNIYADICKNVDVQKLSKVNDRNGKFMEPIIESLNGFIKDKKMYDRESKDISPRATRSFEKMYGIFALKE